MHKPHSMGSSPKLSKSSVAAMATRSQGCVSGVDTCNLLYGLRVKQGDAMGFPQPLAPAVEPLERVAEERLVKDKAAWLSHSLAYGG